MIDQKRFQTASHVLIVLLIVALGVGLVAQFRAQAAPAAVPAGFAYRCGIHFCLDGNTFYFAGANTYDVFTYGGSWGDIETQWMDKARIDAHFAELQADSVKVLRLWMFSHESWHGFEPSKGVYSNEQFSLFDYVIESAKAHNVKLIPVFENYWEAYGGIDTRLSWEGLTGGHPARAKFFNKSVCPGCFTQYKNYVNYALNRVNHYSGVRYKDEPTIFAWELMNEPRYQGVSAAEDVNGTTLRAWVDEMGAYVKSIDPNHMLGTGMEAHEARFGFGGNEGNPFIYIQQSPYIDFTSAHPYPTESWANLSMDQTRALIRTWINESHDIIGKPFYMGEFNSDAAVGSRVDWWNAFFGEMEASDGDGTGFWWYPDPTSKGSDGKYSSAAGAPELAVFRTHAARMAAKNGTVGSTLTPTRTNTAGINTPTRTFTPPVITNTPTRTPTLGGPTATRTRTPTRTATGPTPTRTRTPTVGITFTPTRTFTPPAITNTPTRTFTPPAITLTPTPTTGGGGTCSPVTSDITAPFTFDGAGNFCWRSTNLGGFINSWNTTSVTLNGVNVTNLYVASGSYPAQIGGYWYVAYNGAYAWSHFEAK
jgi:mannan endo-1,4-beta-mannosidase